MKPSLKPVVPVGIIKTHKHLKTNGYFLSKILLFHSLTFTPYDNIKLRWFSNCPSVLANLK